MAVIETDKSDQKVKATGYNINKSWECKVQHGDYS